MEQQAAQRDSDCPVTPNEDYERGFQAGQRVAAREMKAEIDRMFDSPDHDGTDIAHPAWWRGQENGVQGAAMVIQKILDGEDHGKGFCASAELEAVRRRIIALMVTEPVADEDAVV